MRHIIGNAAIPLTGENWVTIGTSDSPFKIPMAGTVSLRLTYESKNANVAVLSGASAAGYATSTVLVKKAGLFELMINTYL